VRGACQVSVMEASVRYDRLGPEDYDRAKIVLNRAKHPGFVGRELFFRCATTGCCVIAVVDDQDMGVALIAKDKLQALSVVSAGQGRGIGAALIAHLHPRWVNAIGERVAWFEKRGYHCVGAPRVSQNGKHSQQLLERSADAVDAESITPIAPALVSASPAVKSSRLSALAAITDETERCEADLELLDELLQNAVEQNDFGGALKIREAASSVIARLDRLKIPRRNA
jgi:GNAT superfamily N-acetyltransferase